MTEREYAIKSFKEVTVVMNLCKGESNNKYTDDMKRLLTYYKKLIAANEYVLEELEQECQEKINADMAYALDYINKYDYRLNVGKLANEMENLMLVYGLSDMIYRAMILVKYFHPKGTLLMDIVHDAYCSHVEYRDVDVWQNLGVSRTVYYREKKEAIRVMGYFFFRVVVPQAKSKRFKPSFPISEEY